jgi:hypothetical protein
VTPDQFTELRRRLSTGITAALVGIFRGLGAWYDPDADRFAVQATPLVVGSQRTLASLVAVYIASVASTAIGRPVPPPPIPDTAVINLRRGVTPERVYRRPFVTLRAALGEGLTLPEAIDRGAHRLQQVAESDMQQTHAEAARAAMRTLPDNAKPTGWRRVLVGTENCALCVAASTLRYTVEDLNPLHANCDCRVEPLFGKNPPVDRSRLDQVNAAIAETTGDRSGRSLRRIVMAHGELGPMLARPKDHFTTPAQLPT